MRTLNQADRLTFFQTLAKYGPEPKTELCYESPFELLVAVILSAQSTDVAVNKATRALFARANTPAAFIELGLTGLLPYIRTIGLYNNKGKNLIATAKILLEEYESQVPQTREALEGLPGVGRKTANVILNTAFGKPTIAVDTHVFRVANRTGLAIGKNVNQVEQALLARIPADYLQDAHHWLILHGRYTCKARKPECHRCSVAALCCYPNKSHGGLAGD